MPSSARPTPWRSAEPPPTSKREAFRPAIATPLAHSFHCAVKSNRIMQTGLICRFLRHWASVMAQSGEWTCLVTNRNAQFLKSASANAASVRPWLRVKESTSYARSRNGLIFRSAASLSSCSITSGNTGTPLAARSARRTRRCSPGRRISSKPGSTGEAFSSRN